MGPGQAGRNLFLPKEGPAPPMGFLKAPPASSRLRCDVRSDPWGPFEPHAGTPGPPSEALLPRRPLARAEGPPLTTEGPSPPRSPLRIVGPLTLRVPLVRGAPQSVERSSHFAAPPAALLGASACGGSGPPVRAKALSRRPALRPRGGLRPPLAPEVAALPPGCSRSPRFAAATLRCAPARPLGGACWRPAALSAPPLGLLALHWLRYALRPSADSPRGAPLRSLDARRALRLGKAAHRSAALRLAPACLCVASLFAQSTSIAGEAMTRDAPMLRHRRTALRQHCAVPTRSYPRVGRSR